MGRKKTTFSSSLAEKASQDLKIVDPKGIVRKLNAIIAASKHSLEAVADSLGVSAETIWRWAKAYEKSGLPGLFPKPKRPRSSKLTNDQKLIILEWIDNAKDPNGLEIYWTLERLRQALIDQFSVTMGINTLWVWLRKSQRKLRVPRPIHSESDPIAQDEFKKNFRNNQETS